MSQMRFIATATVLIILSTLASSTMAQTVKVVDKPGNNGWDISFSRKNEPDVFELDTSRKSKAEALEEAERLKRWSDGMDTSSSWRLAVIRIEGADAPGEFGRKLGEFGRKLTVIVTKWDGTQWKEFARYPMDDDKAASKYAADVNSNNRGYRANIVYNQRVAQPIRPTIPGIVVPATKAEKPIGHPFVVSDTSQEITYNDPTRATNQKPDSKSEPMKTIDSSSIVGNYSNPGVGESQKHEFRSNGSYIPTGQVDYGFGPASGNAPFKWKFEKGTPGDNGYGSVEIYRNDGDWFSRFPIKKFDDGIFLMNNTSQIFRLKKLD